jgi:DtxR family Mn-dependent transcriptional regulator
MESKIDELLEEIWVLKEEVNQEWQPISSLSMEGRKAIPKAVKENYVEKKKDEVRFTEKGKESAKNIIRRHRLAERVLSDLFDLGKEEVESDACKYEHLLNEATADSICILLGHPRTCPHGKPIPPGECCLRKVGEIRPLVVPLIHLKAGEEGEIAYIGTQNVKKITKLSCLGIFPGNKIKLLQKKPSFVLQIDETQIAVDERLASQIYVKRRGGKRSEK